MNRFTLFNIHFLETSSVCRLCLKISSGCNIQTLEGFTMYMLKLVAPAVNLEINTDPKICKSCVENLKSTYDFKSVCLENKGILQAAFLNKTKPQKQNVCKCCLCDKKDNLKKCKENEILFLNTILEKCLPELLDMEKISTICRECLKSVVNLFAFLNCCLDTEDKIKKYVQVKGLNKKGQVSILDVFHTNIFVKEENNSDEVEEAETPEDVEEVENPEVESLEEAEDHPEPVDATDYEGEKSDSDMDSEAEVKIDVSENTLKMEALGDCEESVEDVTVKPGRSQREEMDDSVPLRASNNSVKSSSLKRKRQIRRSASKGRKHFIPGAGRRFKCDKCPYQTDFKQNLLSKHILIHKDKSEVEMHQCEKCGLQTKHKQSLVKHMRRQHDPRAERKFKCDRCSYEADCKRHLHSHNLIHRQKHGDPKAERKFKCDRCSYETDHKPHIRQHNLIHKDKSELKMYKCGNCEFESKYKFSISKHMLRMHIDPKSEKSFKCDKCAYETHHKSNLRRHNKRHKEQY